MSKKNIPIFFACDDAYVPPLTVCLKSISENSSDEYVYDVKILTSSMSHESIKVLTGLEFKNVRVAVVNVDERTSLIRGELGKRLRDYYSESIYYRIFIPSLFSHLDRAIYIDCDTVLVDDIAKMYFEELDGAILGAVADESIPPVPEFCEYTRNWVGVESGRYFNSGVLLMDLSAFRRERLEERILDALCAYNFETVAPDQDYLNFFCRDRVKYLGAGWNKQPRKSDIDLGDIHLIHYNMFEKPWRYRDVLYGEIFWRYAEGTPYYDPLRLTLDGYTEFDRGLDCSKAKSLVINAASLSQKDGGFAATLGTEVCNV